MPWAFTLILTAVAATEVPTSIDELVSHYEQIFKTGNRNAASHLWSSYILDRAAQLEAKTLETLFRGFCPVSGSPLPDQPQTRFYSTLSSVTGEKVSGITHHCCWPCICDTQSAVKTDTKEIQTASGAKSYTFLVIGDPCANSAKLLEGYKDPFTGSQVTLQEQAPEVTCVDNRLSGAHFSSRGHVIIGMPCPLMMPPPSRTSVRLVRSMASAVAWVPSFKRWPQSTQSCHRLFCRSGMPRQVPWTIKGSSWH